ncbi:MAG: hypothetical protein GY906_26990 [bacterium]|nr:hypothetical protein [bacterium]
MRLLLADPSPLTALVLGLLLPAEVDVEHVDTMEAALETVRNEPPEAVLVDVTQRADSWVAFFDFCQNHHPPIPLLVSSSIHRGPAEAGLSSVAGSCFMAMPSDLQTLKRALSDLLDVENAGRQPSAAGARE